MRNWINFNDFKEQYFLEILSYNKYTYSRGIIGLSLLSLPLFTLCNFFKVYKEMSSKLSKGYYLMYMHTIYVKDSNKHFGSMIFHILLLQ